MKRNVGIWLAAIAFVVAMGFTYQQATETQQDYVRYTTNLDFTADSTSDQTSDGYFIGSLYDKEAYGRFALETVYAGDHEVDVYLDFSHDGITWDQYSTVLIDSLSSTVTFDTLTTILGTAPLQWKTSKYFRFRLDPQTGSNQFRFRSDVKIPRTGRNIPNGSVLSN
jgi:hypothetical protein